MVQPVDMEQYRRSALRGPRVPSLKDGDGDGTSGGMEARVAKLESDMGHVKETVSRIDSGVADIKKSLADIRVLIESKAGETGKVLERLDERSKHSPTRWETFGIVLAAMTIVTIAIAVLRFFEG